MDESRETVRWKVRQNFRLAESRFLFFLLRGGGGRFVFVFTSSYIMPNKQLHTVDSLYEMSCEQMGNPFFLLYLFLDFLSPSPSRVKLCLDSYAKCMNAKEIPAHASIIFIKKGATQTNEKKTKTKQIIATEKLGNRVASKALFVFFYVEQSGVQYGRRKREAQG